MSQKTKDRSEIATYLALCEFIVGIFVICIVFPGICGVEEVDCSCAYGHWRNRYRGRGRGSWVGTRWVLKKGPVRVRVERMSNRESLYRLSAATPIDIWTSPRHPRLEPSLIFRDGRGVF